MNATAPLLEINDLRTYFYVRAGTVKAVDGVTFALDPGVKLGLVGESGSGKSTIALSIMRMIKPPGTVNGQIVLDGTDLVQLTNDEMRRARLSQVSMIPQGAMNSLNPVARIGNQIWDGMSDHGLKLNKKEREERIAHLLETVGLLPKVAKMYPHELSGGMKQRVTVAIGMALGPKLIIADEPTSALDVVIQREIMAMITSLVNEMNLSMILIGHDMGLMAQTVDRLAVMYAGKLAEMGNVADMFKDPLHPYTQALISSLPVLGNRGVFHGIEGIPPSVINPPVGCLFHSRCPKVIAGVCQEQSPPLREMKPGHWAACHLYN